MPKSVATSDTSTAAASSTTLEPGEALDPSAAVIGNNVPVREAALNRLVDSLHAQALKRTKFHRHRLEVAEGDVDYISDANEKYNKKLSRAFDKYTVEIKQSLERGSAI
jgi:hypothetical protein